AAGARLLDRRLNAPSRDIAEIRSRHEAVAFLAGDDGLCADLRTLLRAVPDMDRALSRLGLDRGGPRDLAAIRAGLTQARDIAAALAAAPGRLGAARGDLVGHDEVTQLLGAALVAEPPLLTRDGGFIAPGHDRELDETRRLRDEG